MRLKTNVSISDKELIRVFMNEVPLDFTAKHKKNMHI